jgi:hypothetical protein
MMFLKPRLPKHFAYQTLLKKLKSSESSPNTKKIIDLGCCFGQEVRQMILDGVETKNIYAADIHDGYWNAGREFFMDNLSHLSTRLDGVTTLFADFAQPYPLPIECTERMVDSLENNFEAVLCQMVFHVLSKEQTENMAKRMSSMLKKGGILIGCCLGAIGEEAVWGVIPKGVQPRYLQSLKSLTQLFNENGFTDIEIKEIQLGSEGSLKYRNNMKPPADSHPEINKCRYQFFAIKK